MKKWLFTALLAVFALTKADAQFDAHFTHYWKMLNFYNPAGAGAEKRMLIYAAYSNQLTGFENNPKTMLLNIDAPIPFINGDHNLGLGVVNDDIGLFSNQHLYINYAYGFKLFGGRLATGVQLGLVNSIFDSKEIIFGGDNNDPAFPSGNANGNSIDFGAGVLYQHKYFYAGISGIHLNAPLVLLGEKNEIQIDPFLNFTAGGNIPLKNTLITIQPSLQVMTDLVAWRADITARGTYNYNEKEFFGGITYSPTTSVAFFLGIEFMNITASYGYELFTSGIGAKNGSHDIYLGYKIDLNIFKKEKNKHNSIRVLQ
ncbi:MAG: PorP/SprF family type IX secretion system membrane protein [Bacteroidaceae bacterium]|nr:PorP/SprF family type IX secretion system membrane protein [Bacteroidaceae bacterium]